VNWGDSGKIPTLGIRERKVRNSKWQIASQMVEEKGAEETGGVGAAEAGIQRTHAASKVRMLKSWGRGTGAASAVEHVSIPANDELIK